MSHIPHPESVLGFKSDPKHLSGRLAVAYAHAVVMGWFCEVRVAKTQNDTEENRQAMRLRCRPLGLRTTSFPSNGFALKELLVTAAVVGLLAIIVMVEFSRARLRSRSICCNCNLKQVGLGFRTWGLDHSERYPMALSTNDGGTLEYFATGETYRHFDRLSNELTTPFILVCPTDSRRPLQKYGAPFSNSNLSYFVGFLTNDSFPQMFLSGDRNLTGGINHASGIVDFPTNSAIAWGAGIHKTGGNIGLADGSVQQFTTSRLREAIRFTGDKTNRLSIPY